MEGMHRRTAPEEGLGTGSNPDLSSSGEMVVLSFVLVVCVIAKVASALQSLAYSALSRKEESRKGFLLWRLQHLDVIFARRISSDFPKPLSAAVPCSNLAWPPVLRLPLPALMPSPGHPDDWRMRLRPAPPSRIFSSTSVISSPRPRLSTAFPSASDQCILSF